MTLSRRNFIKATGVLGLSNLILPNYLFAAPTAISDHKLVVLYLSGGNDSVNSFVPFNETNYYTKRPTLAIPANQLLMPSSVSGNFDFGFHPALSGLKSIYDNGDMALFPTTHSGTNSNRSHFFQNDYLSQGKHTSNTGGVTQSRGGWLNNFLEEKYGVSKGIEAFNFNSNLKALEGDFIHTKLSNPDNIFLGGNNNISGQSQEILKQFRQNTALSDLSEKIASSQTLLNNNQEIFKNINFDEVQNNANYPDSSLARQLKQSVALFRNIPEFKISFMAKGGWDTHSEQAPCHSSLLEELGDSIKAFYDDLGSERNNVTLLVMSEFGRTALENGSAGTDHGAATAYFAIGGSQINGGVKTSWPGYTDEDLDRGRYLQQTTDYRDLLVEALNWIDDGTKLTNAELSSSFIEYSWDQVKRYTI